MKKLFMMIGLMALTATMAFAQKGVEDGSRFGHGQDSINCLNNISIYSEYVKTNNFEEAYEPWNIGGISAVAGIGRIFGIARIGGRRIG